MIRTDSRSRAVVIGLATVVALLIGSLVGILPLGSDNKSVLLLGVIGAACLALVFFRRYLVYLLIFLPTLVSGPVQVILSGQYTGTGTVALLASGVGVIYLVMARGRNGNSKFRTSLLFPLGVYCAVFAANVMFVGGGLSLDDDVRRWITEIARAVVVYLLALYVCRRDGYVVLRRWLIALLLAEAAISVSALLLTQGAGAFTAVIDAGGEVARDYTAWTLEGASPLVALGGGTFDHANILAACLVLLAPQLWIFGRDSRGASRLFLYLGLGIVTCSLLLTFSRGGWLAFGVGIATMAVLGRTTGRRIGLLAVLGLGALLMVPQVYQMVITRIGWSTTVIERQDLAQTALDLIQRRPWFGYGLAVFSSAEGFWIVNPHNDYVTRLVEGGVIGFVVFLLPFMWMLGSAISTRFRAFPAALQVEAAVFVSGCLAFMVVMATNPVQNLFPLVPVTFAILEARREETQRPNSESSVTLSPMLQRP
jgi:O-antigen ligase